MQENRILNVLPRSVRILLHKEQLQYEYLQEIKLRVEKPLLLIYRGEELILGGQRGKPYMVTKEDVRGDAGIYQQLFLICIRAGNETGVYHD